MSTIFPPESNSGEGNNEVRTSEHSTFWILGVLLGIVILVAGGEGFYCWSLANRIQDLQSAMQTQFSTQDKNIQMLHTQFGAHERNFTDIQDDLSSTKSALTSTEGQLQKARKMADDLAKQEKESTDHLTGQLGQLKADQDTTQRVVGSLSSDVSSTKTDLTATNSNLQRTIGDLGVQSGLIARNGQELAELKQRGERTYVEFDLRKAAKPQRYTDANVALQLKKADTKRQQYTIALVSDDRVIEKKDKNTDEPVQFYQQGNRIPSEIVVNQIYKDRIVGYISVPQMKTAEQKDGTASPAASQPSGS